MRSGNNPSWCTIVLTEDSTRQRAGKVATSSMDMRSGALPCIHTLAVIYVSGPDIDADSGAAHAQRSGGSQNASKHVTAAGGGYSGRCRSPREAVVQDLDVVICVDEDPLPGAVKCVTLNQPVVL